MKLEKKLEEKLEKDGFKIQYGDDGSIYFRKHSPAGHDFGFNACGDDMEEVLESIHICWQDFDVSRETYIWLDDTGHGKNGAPYDMKDVYNDMSKCREMVLELYYAIDKFVKSNTATKHEPLKWEHVVKDNYYIASRDFGDGCHDFIYHIFPVEGGYVAEACNNAYGAERVAVEDEYCEKQSVFKNLRKLMQDIENRNAYWLYTGFCNCVGEVTKEEL